MMKPKLLSVCMFTAIVVFAVASVRASDFTGCYALIENVILEPNDTEPTTVQVWGAFALSDGKPGGGYLPAQRGYLYFKCAEGRDATCLNEWLDLKSVAGKQQIAGFGGRYLGTGRVRKAEDKPAAPDVYPIQMGVFKAGPDAILSDLQKALAKK